MRLTSTLVLLGLCGQAVLAGPCRPKTTTSLPVTTTTTPTSSGTPTTSASTSTGEGSTTTTPGSGTTSTTTPGAGTTSTTTPGAGTTSTTTPGPGTPTTSTTTTPATTPTTTPATTPATTPTTTSTTTTGNFCSVFSVEINVLKDTPEATPFCDNYLSLTTTQDTVIVTVTPTPVNDVVPVTVTVLAVTETDVLTPRRSLDVETKTETIYDTAAVTTVLPSTAVLSCLNSAYTAKPTTTTEVFNKRVDIGNPAFIPADWDSSQISQACSCLALQLPGTTVTHYDTLTPGVNYVTTTQFFTPTVFVTVTPVTTATSYVTDPVTIVSTTVATDYAVETTIDTPGLQYRKFTHTFSEDSPGFTSTYFRNALYNWEGELPSPYFGTPNWPDGGSTLSLADGHTFDSSYTALVFYGFFVAQESGQYTFSSSKDSIDNWGYLWVGDSAYDWTDSNTAFQASRTYAGYYGGTYSVTMNKGDAIPLTWLWANGAGPGQSDFTITTPSGSVIQGGSGNFVPPCSDDVFWNFPHEA